MTVRSGNFLANLPAAPHEEDFTDLLSRQNVRIERIVSTGQASPPGFWYDQSHDEWVCVISGAADILIEGESAARKLRAGDWLELPAHVRHRLEWTDAAQPTVWLAVHVGG